jgi:hypothetical protein
MNTIRLADMPRRASAASQIIHTFPANADANRSKVLCFLCICAVIICALLAAHFPANAAVVHKAKAKQHKKANKPQTKSDRKFDRQQISYREDAAKGLLITIDRDQTEYIIDTKHKIMLVRKNGTVLASQQLDGCTKQIENDQVLSSAGMRTP